MNTKQKHNWIVDAVLFITFLFTYFMDLTGLVLHQWLGVVAGVIALYHLLTHRKWVSAVTSRFFENTSTQARTYYLLDASILTGFAVMIGTGLVISTWFNLALTAYDTWKIVHITSSILTLVAVIIKVLAHWKWIVSVFRTRIARPLILQPAASMARSSAVMAERREFLKIMGVVGVASAIALAKSFESLVQAQTIEPELALVDSAVQTQVAEIVQSTQEASAVVETEVPTFQAATATIIPTQAATATPVTVVQSQASTVSESASSSCSIQCRKGCSFPGRCRKYTDSNSNGKCDLGECA